MRVLLDGRPLQGATGRRGVGRYVAGLVRGLAALEDRPELTLLVDPRGEPVLQSDFDQQVGWAPASAPPGPALLWGRVLGPRWIRGARPDVFHATFLAPPRPPGGAPWVATIHDLIPLRWPRPFTLRQRLVFQRSLRLAAGADRVIAVSRFTADLVAARFGVAPSRLRVIPPPIDVAALAGARRRGLAGVEAPNLLHLGGFDPLKGVAELLIPAFAEIARERADLKLVLTGAPGAGRALAERAAREQGVLPRVHFAGTLADDAHRAVITGAAAVVVSSLEEGFGMPVAEALAAGVPVAVGPAEAAREAAGDAGFLAPDGTPAGLARAIHDALQADGPGSAAGDARRRCAARFDFKVVAGEVLAVYREAMGAA